MKTIFVTASQNEKNKLKENYKQKLPSIQVPKTFFESEFSVQQKEIQKCYENLQNLLKSPKLTIENNGTIYGYIDFLSLLVSMEEFTDTILDLEPLLIIKKIIEKIDDAILIKITLIFLNMMQRGLRGLNLVTKEFKNGSSPLLANILSLIYQGTSTSQPSIVKAIYAGFSLMNLADLELFFHKCKSYSPPKLFNGVIEMIQSKKNDGIGVGCFLLYILKTLPKDLKKDEYYPWKTIVEKKLLDNLKNAQIHDDVLMSYVLFNIHYCSIVSPLDVGFDGILLAKKYMFNTNDFVKLKAVSLYSSVVCSANNDDLNMLIVKSKGFVDEMIKLFSEEKDWELLNQVVRIVMSVVRTSKALKEELSKDDLNLFLATFIALTDLALKDDSFFAEAFIRHLLGTLYSLSTYIPRAIIKTKLVSKIFTKYYKFNVNTQANFLSVLSTSISQLSDQEALEALDEVFGSSLDKFMSHLLKISNEKTNVSSLRDNALFTLKQILGLTEKGRKEFDIQRTGELTKNLGESQTEKINDLTIPLCYCCKRLNGEKRCARCKIAFYCSEECQKNDWRNHKLVCKKPE